MEYSQKLATEELMDLYHDRIKKERQDKAIELEKAIRLESGGKLRTKIFECGHGGNFSAIVFIVDESGDTLLIVGSIEYWNKLKRFVSIMTMPSDEEIEAMANRE
jgi:hypothetical protein